MTQADQNLLDAFLGGAIPVERWDQRTHVAVAFILLSEHPFGEALEKLRSGIKAYNAKNGIAETPTSGYNETTTVALLRIIDSVRHAYGSVFPAHSADAFCDLHPEVDEQTHPPPLLLARAPDGPARQIPIRAARPLPAPGNSRQRARLRPRKMSAHRLIAKKLCAYRRMPCGLDRAI
ncbi:MAG: hypothetical protein R3F11_11670 [Verrucomicrobiales bacterium]